jgi:hypothetical protein
MSEISCSFDDFDPSKVTVFDNTFNVTISTSCSAWSQLVEVIPGGFVYRGYLVDLAGKPLQVLREFVDARYHRVAASELKTSVWGNEAPLVEDRTVKVTVHNVRTSLIVAMHRTKVKRPPKDPIPCVDKLPNLAWRLNLP